MPFSEIISQNSYLARGCRCFRLCLKRDQIASAPFFEMTNRGSFVAIMRNARCSRGRDSETPGQDGETLREAIALW